MKKAFAFVLIVLYTTATSGMVVNMHYCMGKLSSVKIDTLTVKSCMCGEDEPPGDCCTDYIKVLKVDNVHKATVAVFNMDVPVADLPSAVSLIDISKLPSQQTGQPVANAPPDIPAPPLNLLHCVFRV